MVSDRYLRYNDFEIITRPNKFQSKNFLQPRINKAPVSNGNYFNHRKNFSSLGIPEIKETISYRDRSYPRKVVNRSPIPTPTYKVA